MKHHSFVRRPIVNRRAFLVASAFSSCERIVYRMLGRLRGAMTDSGPDVFLLPGPVKMAPRVLQTMARPAMNHRGAEFKEILAEIRALTQYMFGTKGKVAVLSGSGTAGLEAAVTGLLRREDRVLNLVNGKFSQRFHELAQVYATATPLSFEWGTAVNPKKVSEALEAGSFPAGAGCLDEEATRVPNPSAGVAEDGKEHAAFPIAGGVTARAGVRKREAAEGPP